MRKIKKMLAAFVSLLLSVLLIAAAGFTQVFAAGDTTYTLQELMSADKVKTIGRTVFENGKLLADWVGTGFEVNVNANAGTFSVSVDKTDTSQYYIDILIDGELAVRSDLTESGVISAPISAGNHTVTVIRDSQNNNARVSSGTVTLRRLSFTQIAFNGTVLEKPEDKDLYIEFVGDSYCCGDGSVGEYEAGVLWTCPRDDSVTGSFAFNAAKELGADYSLVARGGIGLTGTDAQQVADTITVEKVYDYATYDSFNLENNSAYASKMSEVKPFDFSSARKPDFVVIEIGANDGQASAVLPIWKQKAADFIDQIRNRWNDENLPIVWITTSANYNQNIYMRTLAQTDPNLHPWRYHQGGNGSAAKATQEAGHPSKTQQIEWGKQLAQFIKSEKLDVIGGSVDPVPQPKANTFEVYADGVQTSEENHYQYIGQAEAALANMVKTVSGGNDAIDAIIYVSNRNGAVNSSAVGTSSNALFNNATAVKDSKGNYITVQIIGVDDANTGNAPEIYVGRYTSTWRKAVNWYRFENVCISGSGDTNGSFTQIYANGMNVVFDKNTSVWQSSTTKAHNAAGLSTVYGGHPSNATATNAGVSTNVTINSDKMIIGTFLAGGINRFSAGYNATAKTFDLNSGSATTANITVNAGKVSTLAVGNANLVGGKNFTSNITVNGGEITNLYNGLSYATATAPTSLEQKFTSNVTVNGGTVKNYYGAYGDNMNYGGTHTFTMNGGKITDVFTGTTDPANSITVNKTVNNINGGLIGVLYFHAVGAKTTAQTIENNITGGEILCRGTTDKEGIFLGGFDNLNATTVTNNISGGAISNVMTTASANSQMWFGGRSNSQIGTLTNNISGGAFTAFLTPGITKTSGTTGIYFGNYSGSVETFNNNVYAGLFDLNPVGSGTYQIGGQSTSNSYGKVNNVFGYAGTDIGPQFKSRPVNLSSGWGKVGEGVKSSDSLPTDIVCSDTVVIKNTVNYLEAAGVITFGTSGIMPDKNYYSFVKGSIENVINGGLFENTVYLGGARVYGHVKTTINGGVFKDVYGYGVSDANGIVYDGTELIINDFSSYANIADKNYAVYGAGNTSTVVAPQTENRDAVSLTINGGNFPSRCKVFGGSNTGDVNGNIKTTVAGGNLSYFYGGSNNATVTGNINNTITNGTISSYYFAGNCTGTVDGHINTLINTSGKMSATHGGGENCTITNGTELHIRKYRTTNADKSLYATSKLGTVSLKENSEYENAVVLDIYSAKHSDKYNAGDVSIDGSLFLCGNAVNINGNVYAKLSGGSNTQTGDKARHLVLGNQNISGVINGNIYAEIERGGYYGGAVYLGHRTAPATPEVAEINGDITLKINSGHIGTLNNPNNALTFNGKAHVILDQTNGSSIFNNVVGGTNAKYDVHVKGGKYSLTLTANGRLFADTAEVDAENTFNINQYSNMADGTVIAELPEDVTDNIVITKGASITDGHAVSYNGEKTSVIVLDSIQNEIAAQFELDEAITAQIMFPADNNIKTVINKVGRANYSYTFLGETVKGYFDAKTPIMAVEGTDYYVVTFPVPTGKFDESISISCNGFTDKNVTTNTILEAGIDHYSDDPEITKLFGSLIDYGKEAAALFYEGEAPEIDYSGIDAIKEKYDFAPQIEKKTMIKGTSLYLEDQVNIHLYIKTDDISKITGVTLDGVTLTSDGYSICEVTDPELLSGGFTHIIRVPISASKMKDSFNISIVCGDTVTDSYTSSIGFYCATYIDSSNAVYAKYANLSKALLKYIDQVATCFGD